MVSLKKNKGLKLWNKAKKIIPGGNSLLSKRPDRFAPDIWPNCATASAFNDMFRSTFSPLM